MRHKLQKKTLLLFLLLGLFSVANAETIVKFDGANNEFVTADWTVDSPGFAITSAVQVMSGTSATLTISNTNSYKNITVEILYEKVNNSYSNSIMCDLKLVDNNSQTLTKTQLISDNTSQTENVASYNFSNTSGFQLTQFVFSNPNKNAKIVYLKITGDKVGGGSAGLSEEQLQLFNVYVGSTFSVIHAKQAGNMTVYNAAGQEIASFAVHQGKNTLQRTFKGLSIFVLRNKENAIIGKMKMVH